jgi:DNA-directed RNA polymerase subunit RPC12/RpoP
VEKLRLTEITPGQSPDYYKERTGRCTKCNIRFIWPQTYSNLKGMICPKCGSRLAQTTHMFKGKTIRITIKN